MFPFDFIFYVSLNPVQVLCSCRESSKGKAKEQAGTPTDLLQSVYFFLFDTVNFHKWYAHSRKTLSPLWVAEIAV